MGSSWNVVADVQLLMQVPNQIHDAAEKLTWRALVACGTCRTKAEDEETEQYKGAALGTQFAERRREGNGTSTARCAHCPCRPEAIACQ